MDWLSRCLVLSMLLASCGPEVDSDSEVHFELWRGGEAVEFDTVSCEVSKIDDATVLKFRGVDEGSNNVTDSWFSYSFSVELDPSLLQRSSHEVNGQLLSTFEGPNFVPKSGHHSAVKSVTLEYHWLTVNSEYRNDTQGSLHITELSNGFLVGDLDIDIQGSIPGSRSPSGYQVQASMMFLDGSGP